MPSIIHTPLSTFAAATALLTHLRDARTPRHDFVRFANRFCILLAEAVLGLYSAPCSVTTPTGSQAPGLSLPPPSRCAAVSIVRSGDVLAAAFASLEPLMCCGGKLLIQRDEAHPDKPARFLLRKLPPSLPTAERVFLCDPMLASGGSVLLAIEELLRAGVAEERVVFVCLVAAPEGLAKLAAHHPKVEVVCGCVDEGLNGEKFILPGLGDFGDRWFGTL